MELDCGGPADSSSSTSLPYQSEFIEDSAERVPSLPRLKRRPTLAAPRFLGVPHEVDGEVEELPDRPVYDYRFASRVHRNLRSLLGSWVTPGRYWFDTTESEQKQMVGFFILPLWFGLTFVLLCLAMPVAFSWALLAEVADYWGDSVGIAKNGDQSRSNAAAAGGPGGDGPGLGRVGGGAASGGRAAGGPVVNSRASGAAILGAGHSPFSRRPGSEVPMATGYLRTDGPVALAGADILDCAFSSPLVGIVLVDGFTFYQLTEDGGLSYRRCKGPFGSQPRRVHFLEDGSVGWMTGTGGRLARSVDGGRSWKLVENADVDVDHDPDGNRWHHCVHGLWTPSTASWGGDPTGTFRRTPVEFTDISFLDDQRGYALVRLGPEAPDLVRTATGGEKWAALSLDGREAAQAANYPLCLSFIDEHHGWVGDMSGRVFRSDDGGCRWRQESWYLPEAVMGVWVGSTGLGVAVGLEGNCWVRGKNKWVKTDNVIGSSGWAIRSVADCDGSRLAVGTSRGLLFLRWNVDEDEVDEDEGDGSGPA